MWPASHIMGFALEAKDGIIGSVADLLCDDRSWTIRWFAIDTGSWLPGRQVLLPPSCFGEVDNIRRSIPVFLDEEQIRTSPGVETDKPVSRQTEAALYNHYGQPPYWTAGLGYLPLVQNPATAPAPVYGGTSLPAGQEDAIASELKERIRRDVESDRDGDEHLRSIDYMTGFNIEAKDGGIGHVEDFLIEDENWQVRYLVVDTVNWWPGKKVLVAPAWASDISWRSRSVTLDLTRRQIRESPEYDPAAQLDRSYEERLHRHYGYPPYWP